MFKTIAKMPVYIYKAVISPFFPSCCRYHPTCSTYALEAIDKHGAVKGSWLALKRIVRCAPWSKHPVNDPVPDK